MMFSKHILTFLAIGTLCVNVSATPIPISFSFLRRPGSKPEVGPSGKPGPEPDVKPGLEPGVNPDLKSGPTWKDKAKYGGELPQSFSALSYRNLTFAFSVVIGAIAGGSLIHAMNPSEPSVPSVPYDQAGSPPGGSTPAAPPPASKREPVPEDEGLD